MRGLTGWRNVSALLGLLYIGSTRAGLVAYETCGRARAAPTPARALPPEVTGRIGFYAVAYRSGAVVADVALGGATQVFPTASMFKTLVVHAALRQVDAGKLGLNQRFTTTEANRSIESYPQGTHTLLELAKRAIHHSDNTASDILHRAAGPLALAKRVKQTSPCTNLLLTTKAWWAAQGGLLSEVLGADLIQGARAYAAQPFEARLRVAARLNEAARGVTAGAVEAGLETYFHGPDYSPALEWQLQNTTTPQAYSELLVKLLPAPDLKPRTRALFREIMHTGCCIPQPSRLQVRYRAAKAGSGWRILTLSGYAELPDGVRLAYTYMNDQSDTQDAEAMEQQIRPVNAWIEQVLLDMTTKAR